uniref:MSP domain-containing protein n=1 Tax=Globodera pallida TaxID=36090 RepID=A0A183BN71_GLOPA
VSPPQLRRTVGHLFTESATPLATTPNREIMKRELRWIKLPCFAFQQPINNGTNIAAVSTKPNEFYIKLIAGIPDQSMFWFIILT